MFGFAKKGPKWTEIADVVVLGTGGAGLVAAISAHDTGARVVVLEKSDRVGGTTAVSGGVVWVPNNPHMPGAGVGDSRDEALGYIRLIAAGRADESLLGVFLDSALEMLAHLESKTPVKFQAVPNYADYHPEHPGGKPGARSLETELFDTNDLGEWKEKLRRSPIFGGTPMTVVEATSWGVFSSPLSLPYAELGKRFKQGKVSGGASLIGRLLKACLDRGVPPRLESRAQELVTDDSGRVIGVKVTSKAGESLIQARKGVVLATGGFEWDAALAAAFLTGIPTHPNSPVTNTGDGLRMAMAQGADLANMNEAWWCPSIDVPGEQYEGRQLHRGDFAVRALPHSIVVNRSGRRFTNEAHNYNDMMKPFFDWDPVAYGPKNLPAFLIVDQQFLDKYLFITSVPGMKPPEFVTRAETLNQLAVALGIDPAGLAAEVSRFNGYARDGRDPDFRRGESLYDHFYGDPKQQPNPNLGALEKAPFYAVPMYPGTIGTKGGPRTNAHGQVLRVSGQPVDGLYAAGNVAAGIFGPGYPGAGATIGAAMTFGFLAGRHAARQAPVG